MAIVENILTVDLEDWFHICGIEDQIPEDRWPDLESRVEQNTARILSFLSRRHVKATFFVLGYTAERHAGLIRTIAEAGHEIATHGYGHRRVYTMTADGFLEDLRKAEHVISRITGVPVKGYRAPEWSIRDDSLWALDILLQEGFEYDSSMAPLPVIGNQGYAKTPYRLIRPQGCLWEFPPLVAPTPLVNLLFGGGWGLRVFPYSMIRRRIKRLNERGHPALLYFHPREFESFRVPVKLPWSLWFVLYARLEGAEKRLHRLLEDFRFTTVWEVLRRLKGNHG